MNEPFSFFMASGIIAIIGVLLALKCIPPNSFIGVRTAKTLRDRDLWFRLNRFAGFALLLSSLISLSIYCARPELSSGRSFAGLLIFIAPLLVALTAILRYLRGIAS